MSGFLAMGYVEMGKAEKAVEQVNAKNALVCSCKICARNSEFTIPLNWKCNTWCIFTVQVDSVILCPPK